MTLLVAYTDAKFQVIAADRRLTPFNKSENATDSLFKVACFANETAGYWFVIGYTGYASDGAKFDTLGWLVAALPVCFGPTTRFDDGLAALAAAFTKKLATFGEGGRQVVTRLLLCGGMNFSDVGKRPFLAYVTNRTTSGAGSKFRTKWTIGNGPTSYLCEMLPRPPEGKSDPLVKDLYSQIRTMSRLESYPSKVELLVKLIRKRYSGNRAGSVGPDVIAAWHQPHPSDPTKGFATGWEWPFNNPVGYGLQPPIVTASGITLIDGTNTNGYVGDGDPNLPNLRSKVPRRADL